MATDLKMPQINSIVVSGRFVHTPKFRKTDAGLAIATLSIAVDRGFGEKRKTSYFDCTAFGKCAELIEKHMAEGGVPVIIEGQIEQRKWKDKEDNPREKVQIIIDSIHRLDWPDGGSRRPEPQSRPDAVDMQDGPPDESDLPF